MRYRLLLAIAFAVLLVISTTEDHYWAMVMSGNGEDDLNQHRG